MKSKYLSVLSLAITVTVALTGCGSHAKATSSANSTASATPKMASASFTSVPTKSQSPADSAAVFAKKAYPIVEQIAALYGQDSVKLQQLSNENTSYASFRSVWNTNEAKIKSLDDKLQSLSVDPTAKPFQTKLVGLLNQRLSLEKQFESTIHSDGTANQSAFASADKRVASLDSQVKALFAPYINAKG